MVPAEHIRHPTAHQAYAASRADYWYQSQWVCLSAELVDDPLTRDAQELAVSRETTSSVVHSLIIIHLDPFPNSFQSKSLTDAIT